MSVIRPSVVEAKLELPPEPSLSIAPVAGPRPLSSHLLEHQPALAPGFDEPVPSAPYPSSPTTGLDEHTLATILAAAARRHGIEIL